MRIRKKNGLIILSVMFMCMLMFPVKTKAASHTEIQQKIIQILYSGSGGRMSCDFDGYVNTSGRHEGIDFCASGGAGTSIYALSSGVVTRVSNSSSLSTLAIYDSVNDKTVVYLHGKYSLSEGNQVSQGQHIGVESNLGASAAHTHVEVRDGRKTAAAKSVNDNTLENSDPYPYWNTVLFSGSSNHTSDGTYSGYVPFKTYAINTGNINVYNESGTQYTNRYITGSSDLCTINAVYTDGWCQVTYPSSAEASGYFTAYAPLSEFISNASPTSWTAGSDGTAYRRSTGSDTIGSVSSGDKCLKVSSANGRIQVIYPVSGQSYCKMGWVVEGGTNSGTVATDYKLPCKTYAINTGNISVYDSNHTKYSNRYITGSSDLCTLNAIYTDGWCQVTYPSSASGTFTAYTPLSEFISNPNPISWTATGDFTAYRRSTGGDTIGSVSKGDACVKVSSANGRTQVMYPVSGQNYYKMGWIETGAASNPQGCVDSITGNINSVSVSGWAFDYDDINATLGIHVYIDSTGIGSCTANLSRPDVNNVYGVGDYHGFSATFDVPESLRGNRTVYVYAINVGDGNANPLIGSANVTIGSDTTAPSISNVTVSDVSSSGYTVSCTVTDENGVDRVQFPTWTLKDGQDDIFADWQNSSSASGTKDGNKYTYRVHASAHNYEGGTYRTHIYAYDKYGNGAVVTVPDVEVPIETNNILLSKNTLIFEKIGATEKLTATVYPENATDKTVTWSTSDDSIATVKDGLVEAVGSGTTTITATTSNGLYDTCEVTVGEQPSGIITVEDGTGAEKDKVTVAVCLDSNPGIIAARLKVSYDASVMALTDVKDGGILGEYVFGNDLSANPYIVMWENGLATTNYSEIGDLVYLTFTIADGAQPGKYDVKIEYNPDEIYNIDLKNVAFTVNQGTVTVEESSYIADGNCGENLTWSLDKEGILTISGSGDMTYYTYVKEVPWYEYASQITSVVIEEGVTSIGDYALYGLKNMTSVSIPEGVTKIGDYAFKNSSSLAEIALPSTLKKLGESAFYGCSGLTGITIPEGVYTVWAYTFKNCTSLAEVTLPSTLIKIDEAAFYGCSSLKELNIPDDVSVIGIYCFKNCTSLTSVSLPAKLTQIREAAFYGTGLTGLDVPEGVTRIDAYAFKNAVSLATLALPESLTKIGEAAFYSSTISELTIPDAVESIGSYAFKNCTSLCKIQLPANLGQISESSFYGCTKVGSITIPDKVTSIGNYAFRKCSGLKSVDFSTGLTSIGESSFYGCEALTGIAVPEGVTTISGYAFKGCTGLTEVTLPDSLTEIGESALYGCTGLTEITIPQNVSVIGNYTFANCTRLETVRFLGNAPSIGEKVFSKVNAQAFYPANNNSWTSEVMQNYGGHIEWIEETAESVSALSEEIGEENNTIEPETEKELKEENSVQEVIEESTDIQEGIIEGDSLAEDTELEEDNVFDKETESEEEKEVTEE